MAKPILAERRGDAKRTILSAAATAWVCVKENTAMDVFSTVEWCAEVSQNKVLYMPQSVDNPDLFL